MADSSQTRECPFCKEEIRADAIKCKHCRSTLQARTPSHEGICPFCKEEIKPDAIKCKHCGSMVGSSSKCCDECADKVDFSSASSQFHLADRSATGNPFQPEPASSIAAEASCSGCGRFGNSNVGFRLCCKRVYIPFLGYQTVCWPEPCYSGTIFTT